MKGFTETGYLKIQLNSSVLGVMSKEHAASIERELLEFFKERKLNIEGKISYVSINTSDIEKNYQNLDTSTL